MTLPSLSISTRGRLLGTNLLTAAACCLVAASSRSTGVLSFLLLASGSHFTSVFSINRTWITLKSGSCFMEEQEEPCSPATTSRHKSPSTDSPKCFIQARFIFSMVYWSCSYATNSLAPMRENF